MKINELDNIISQDYAYEYLIHNGTRIKRIKKSMKCITYQRHKYFVPRVNLCQGTISDFCIIGIMESGHYNDESNTHTPIGFNETEGQNLSFGCKFKGCTEHLFEEETQELIVMSIFREGADKPIYQEHLTSDDDNDFEFAQNLELGVGNYLIIISGVNTTNAIYNHEDSYTIYPLCITSTVSSYSGIKNAKFIYDGNSLVCTRQPISLEIEHRNSIYNPIKLLISCIDSKMNVVEYKHVHLTPKSNNQKDYINITPQYFWAKDENYTVIVGNEKGVISTIEFSINNPKSCLVKNSYKIEKLISNYYKMYIGKDYMLKDLYPQPGLSQIRVQAALLYGKRLKALEINQMADKEILPTQHNLIVTSERPHFESMLGHPTIIINNSINNYLGPKFIDCEKLRIDNSLNELDCEDNYCVWHNITALNENRGKALPYMTQYLLGSNYVTLYDAAKNIKRFFEVYPEFAPFFAEEYTFHEALPTAIEMAAKFIFQIKENSQIPISGESITHIYQHMEMIEQQGGSFDKYDNATIRFYVQAHVEKQVQKRIINSKNSHAEVLFMNKIEPIDLDFGFFEQKDTNYNIDEILRELNEMTGLDTIKENIINLSTQLQFNRRRRELGFPETPQSSHHMLFIGNPGTGKTTVAKMIGKIFHSMGILSKGEVIATERSELVGSYIGHTEEKIREVLTQAKGNVLFIDEAYSLCVGKGDSNDFGKHIIEALLPILANENCDTLVILAGYKDEMERLLDSNSGLKGRFPHQWKFDNYNADELLQIGCNYLEKQSYKLSGDARECLLGIIQKVLNSSEKNFSNARWIKQQITYHILPAMAKRVMKESSRCDTDFYATIEKVDMESIVLDEKQEEKEVNPAPRNPIGFCATHKGVA